MTKHTKQSTDPWDEPIKLKLYTTFKLAHIENVQRLAMALMLSGYHVSVRKHTDIPEYNILVYAIL